MLQIIYASAATRPLSSEELQGILTTARRHNTTQGVTGLLVYHDGSFLQVLEGPANAVLPLVARIEGDPRHTRFRLLASREIETREFGQWSMGFAEAPPEVAGLDGFAAYGSDLDAMVPDGARARRVLQQFRDGAWRQSAAAPVVVTRR